ncbi:MAG: hypothetical protein JSS04_10175, partial [Proteobacteria bacterium]|nr:hypothetical protein [Pseudomonadota bacterium]
MLDRFSSLQDLKAFVAKTEAAREGHSHDPAYLKWYNARRILSCMVWDLFTAQCMAHYAREKQPNQSPQLSTNGYATGTLSLETATAILEAFKRSPLYAPVSGHEIADGDFFSGGVSEESAERTRQQFRTHKMTDQLAKLLHCALASLAGTIEGLAGYYWMPGHVRLYERAPEETSSDDGWHLDGWPIGIYKLYLYLEGASEELGTTQIRYADGTIATVEGGLGTWAIFANSVLMHRAYPSPAKWRPAIEIPILPALATDPTPKHRGCTGSFPWYPVDFAALNGAALPEAFSGDALEYRSLMRTLGLARNIP